MKRTSLYTLILLILSKFVDLAGASESPNIILYLADDLGTGDVNQYANGFTTPNFKPNRVINTPNLEKFAQQGMRFQSLWAASVCAPSRNSLLQGVTIDTSRVRSNADIENGKIMTINNITLPLALWQMGYATGVVGKYGLGDANTASSAWNIGFRDMSFGYSTHKDAHYPFPTWIWNGTNKVFFTQNAKASRARCLNGECVDATAVFKEQALGFIRKYANNKPFFLYWATIAPHVGKYRATDNKFTSPVTTYYPYSNTKWPIDRKGYASMVNSIDQDIAALLATLHELNIDNDKTIIIFTSDNNAEIQFTNGKRSYPVFFQSTGGDKGHKGTMYNGGIRVPGIVVWPNHVPAGTNSFYPFAFSDISKTLLSLIHAPQNILDQFPDRDSTRAGATTSVAPLWLNGDMAAYDTIPRDWLSSEHCPDGTEKSCLFAFLNVRNGLKLLSVAPNKPSMLYNISSDPGETKDLALDPRYAETIEYMRNLRDSSRIPILN